MTTRVYSGLALRWQPYWWAADVRTTWDFGEGRGRPKKGGDRRPSNGRDAGAGGAPLLEKLREAFEAVVTCGSSREPAEERPRPLSPFFPMSP